MYGTQGQVEGTEAKPRRDKNAGGDMAVDDCQQAAVGLLLLEDTHLAEFVVARAQEFIDRSFEQDLEFFGDGGFEVFSSLHGIAMRAAGGLGNASVHEAHLKEVGRAELESLGRSGRCRLYTVDVADEMEGVRTGWAR